MSDLKPCPFCGSEAHFIELGGNDKSLFDVICLNRKCIMRAGSQVSFFTAESAISAWNTRSSESAIRAHVIDEVLREVMILLSENQKPVNVKAAYEHVLIILNIMLANMKREAKL